MAKLKNISPLGDLEIPALGITVAAGETFDVDDDIAPGLAAQSDNFKAVDKAAKDAAASYLTGAEPAAEPDVDPEPERNDDENNGANE